MLYLDIFMWLGKALFSFFGAKKEQMIWLQNTADELHRRGWLREEMILTLDAAQQKRLNARVRAIMKEKDKNREPERPSDGDGKRFDYKIPEIVEVDCSMETKGEYRTPSGEARGLVVHFTAGRNENGAADGINGVKGLAARGLGCMFMDYDGVIYKSKDQKLNQVAYHAGSSQWKGKKGVSLYCMGMEICCPGKVNENGQSWFGKAYPLQDTRLIEEKTDNIKKGRYVKFSEAQEHSLVNFILWQMDVNPEFSLDWVVGHDEIAPSRKSDPGGSLSVSMPRFRSYLKSLL